MWLKRIQELDDVLMAIQVLTKEKSRRDHDVSSWSGLEEHAQLFRQLNLSIIKSQHEIYRASISRIVKLCLLPTLIAIVASALDLIFDTLLMMRGLATAMLLLLTYAIFNRADWQPPMISLTVLAALLSLVSRSVAEWVCLTMTLDAIVSPLLCHINEDISDETEVRWVLFGFLFNLTYIATIEILSFARYGLLLGVLLPAWWVLIACVVGIAVHDERWTSDGHPQAQHLLTPTSKLSSMYRWPVQRMMFALNRFVKNKMRTSKWMIAAETSPGLSFPLITYQYNNLGNKTEAHKGDFRVLRILKGRPEQEVSCRLEIVTSANQVEYEAISYVWGKPPHEEVEIRVNDCSLTITKSAYEIVQRRRSSYKDRVIWIDQVCINQKDKQERQYQVQIMKDIYQGASGVVAYLGPSENAYLLQAHFAELYWRQEVLGYSPEEMQASYQFEQKAAQWDAQVDFFAHFWFRRVWIIQEATFAKKLMLIYGDICMDWISVSRTLNVLFDQKILGTPQSNDPFLFSEKRWQYQSGLHNLDSMLELRGDVNYGEPFTLARVLEMAVRSESTDPRDKVYAILGLTTDLSKHIIIPDYDKRFTVGMVYTKAARYILERDTDPLDVLKAAGIGFEKIRTITDLPSWVPDWSQTDRTFMVDEDYSAGMIGPASVSFSPSNDSVLVLKGFCFDRVGPVQDFTETFQMKSDWTHIEADTYMKEWYRAAETLARTRCRSPYRFLTTQSVLEAFVRTMNGNRSSYGRDKPATRLCVGDYDAFHTLLELKQRIKADLDAQRDLEQYKDIYIELDARCRRFLHFSGQVLRGKRFCVSSQGRLAVVPPYCLENDVFCVIQGSRTPYVLREVKGAGLKIVGSCYVHGSMDGENCLGEAQVFLIT